MDNVITTVTTTGGNYIKAIGEPYLVAPTATVSTISYTNTISDLEEKVRELEKALQKIVEAIHGEVEDFSISQEELIELLSV